MNTPEVAMAARITYRQASHWVRMGFVPGMKAEGTGKNLTWTVQQVAHVKRMAALVRAGFRPDAAAALASTPGVLRQLAAQLKEMAA